MKFRIANNNIGLCKVGEKTGLMEHYESDTVFVPCSEEFGKYIFAISKAFFKEKGNSKFPEFRLTQPLKNSEKSCKIIFDAIVESAKKSGGQIRIIHLAALEGRNSHAMFKALKKALSRKSESEINFLIDLDERYLEAFIDCFADVAVPENIDSRFSILRYAFHDSIETKAFDSYLRELIEIIFGNDSLDEVIIKVMKLLETYLGPTTNKSLKDYLHKNLELEYLRFNALEDHEKALFKEFAFESVQLYIKLNRILNRIDILRIAYFTEYEYDFYTYDLMDDMFRFPNVERIYDYLVERFEAEESLNELNYWGDEVSCFSDGPENKETTEEITGEKTEATKEETTEDIDDSGIIIHELVEDGRGYKRARNSTKLKWGAKEIHKALSLFRKKYSKFF
jgi:hypothetical protein